jgi:hypothetical protein
MDERLLGDRRYFKLSKLKLYAKLCTKRLTSGSDWSWRSTWDHYHYQRS